MSSDNTAVKLWFLTFRLIFPNFGIQGRSPLPYIIIDLSLSWNDNLCRFGFALSGRLAGLHWLKICTQSALCSLFPPRFPPLFLSFFAPYFSHFLPIQHRQSADPGNSAAIGRGRERESRRCEERRIKVFLSFIFFTSKSPHHPNSKFFIAFPPSLPACRLSIGTEGGAILFDGAKTGWQKEKIAKRRRMKKQRGIGGMTERRRRRAERTQRSCKGLGDGRGKGWCVTLVEERRKMRNGQTEKNLDETTARAKPRNFR